MALCSEEVIRDFSNKSKRLQNVNVDTLKLDFSQPGQLSKDFVEFSNAVFVASATAFSPYIVPQFIKYSNTDKPQSRRSSKGQYKNPFLSSESVQESYGNEDSWNLLFDDLKISQKRVAVQDSSSHAASHFSKTLKGSSLQHRTYCDIDRNLGEKLENLIAQEFDRVEQIISKPETPHDSKQETADSINFDHDKNLQAAAKSVLSRVKNEEDAKFKKSEFMSFLRQIETNTTAKDY